MYVIGTAGHVDHGKSTLVRALSGIDPDRLREEKERGLTIDLGFAWLTLPSGREISIVDVPGHERFIKNMLAGAGGVDLALLVVAADEGPMPQTREHLAILDLLDVPDGLVVITKTDLVEPDYVELVEAELAETLMGTMLSGSQPLRVSGVSGEGLEALKAAVDRALAARPPKRDLGRPRLPIDRAFGVQGFGVVVTGTLIDGSLQVGDEVEFQPGRIRARIRGLQRHKSKVTRLLPGTRAAVNLSGVRLEQIRRGMVIGHPGSISVARSLDVRLKGTSLQTHPLRHNAVVTLLAATAESEARLRMLDAEELSRGDECWAQLVLESPIAAVAGDYLVLRTANETVAGGRIVAINPRRHRFNDAIVLENLRLRLEGTTEDRLLEVLRSGPSPVPRLAEALSSSQAAVAEAVGHLSESGELREKDGVIISTAWLEGTVARLLSSLEDYLADFPLRMVAPREHIRAALGLASGHFDLVVDEATRRGAINELPAGLAPTGHQVKLTASQQADVDRFLVSLQEGRYSPPTNALPDPELLSFLVGSGLVEDTGAGVVFDRAVFEEMQQLTLEHIAAEGAITLAETRDLFGTSRKYAQAFLEHLDELKLTRRAGDARVARAVLK